MLIGHLNKPNLVTLSGMILALAAVLLASRGYIAFAMVGLIGAGICDLFDGFVARASVLSHEEQGFGAELDSLNDVLCFGLLPVLLVDAWLRESLFYPIYAAYLIAVLFRLAYFNQHGTALENGTASYTGLPVTYAALALPLLALPAAWLPDLKWVLLPLTLLALAGLYVYKTPIPKPAGKAYIAFPALALIVSLIWLWQPWGGL
ncbi:MAG: phosphatidylserine synthase, partial [Candidatus Melainabacteria bacterium HGW-Melainabacteria-1]